MAEAVGFEPTSPKGLPDFECCLSLADSWLEQVSSGSFVRSRKPRRREGLRTFRPVSARGDLNRPRVQIKPRSCVKSRRSCAFARSQARKYMPCQRRWSALSDRKMERSFVMTYDAKELAQYPDIMNKEQLRKVCHISKRTAHYLLQFNLIPHVCTGKKTRCYAIKKRDVIDFSVFPLLQERSHAAGRFSPAPRDRDRSPALPRIRSPEALGASDGPR